MSMLLLIIMISLVNIPNAMSHIFDYKHQDKMIRITPSNDKRIIGFQEIYKYLIWAKYEFCENVQYDDESDIIEEELKCKPLGPSLKDLQEISYKSGKITQGNELTFCDSIYYRVFDFTVDAELPGLDKETVSAVGYISGVGAFFVGAGIGGYIVKKTIKTGIKKKGLKWLGNFAVEMAAGAGASAGFYTALNQMKKLTSEYHDAKKYIINRDALAGVENYSIPMDDYNLDIYEARDLINNILIYNYNKSDGLIDGWIEMGRSIFDIPDKENKKQWITFDDYNCHMEIPY